MIAARFNPLDIECLVKTAAELWGGIDPSDLSEHQQETLDRARDAVLAEHADQQPHIPEVVTFISPRPVGKSWVLRRWDRSQDQVTLHTDDGSALTALAGYVRGAWDKLVAEEGVADRPPSNDRETVRLYYGPERDCRPDEGYDLYAEDIAKHGRTRIVPLDFRFPNENASEQANRDATFHPQTDENDLPCMEIDGVLVFAYLNHESGVVEVSVHLECAEGRLVRPDGTVPLRVAVEDAVVLDDSAEPASERNVLNKLLDAADDRQEQAIREAAFVAGVLWRCPTCKWDNHGKAPCCEGPGPCHVPKPKKAVGVRSQQPVA
ncbi:hypothetical protein AB0A98_06320 [Streptomyces chrestomyceticus]|uniref:hypothetical protein n=1 Tax=Streptomyces chrestomyceticus TaxID=68185 RepID=UPI0033E75F95